MMMMITIKIPPETLLLLGIAVVFTSMMIKMIIITTMMTAYCRIYTNIEIKLTTD